MELHLDTISWSIAEGRTDSYLYQLRFRNFSPEFPRNQFHHRLNIFWRMAEPNSEGYASTTELERLHLFEDRLIAAMESDDFAVLAIVLTGRAEREFVFYTSDSKEFIRRLSAMPQETERYPIKIHFYEDLDWEYFDNEIDIIS
jgi:hypothetical protein